jgi:hypothetical protein
VTDLDDAPYCRVCKTALNLHTGPAGNYYEHARREFDDHTPEPVPVSTLKGAQTFCDFCSAPNPAWVYSTVGLTREQRFGQTQTVSMADYWDQHNAARVRSSSGGTRFSAHLGETWASCEDCANLIDVKDLLALIWRVTNAMPTKLTKSGRRLPEIRGELTEVYGTLFATIAAKVPNPMKVSDANPA